MPNPFQKVRIKKPKKSLFDLSHEKKLSLKMGGLYPCLLEEVVPGDSFMVNSEAFLRVAPMIAPIMHRINVFIHYFFVPMRLIWDTWEEFITGGYDGLNSDVIPYATITNTNKSQFAKGTLADYLGFPALDDTATFTNSLNVNFLPWRAYGLIFNEFYQDMAISNGVTVDTGDTVSAGDITSLYDILTRSWEKDYFTSARPEAQLGAQVEIGGYANYETVAVVNPAPGSLQDLYARGTTGHVTNSGTSQDYGIENIESVAIGIDDLRQSLRLQEWLEKNMRAGSRYIEQILSHFGVRSSDSRLHRPEYLGGGMSPISVSEVLNTSATATEPQGNMAGHGVSVGSNQGFKRGFEEHGYVMGIMSVLPRTCYQQGVPKTFLRSDKFDFAWPEFAHIGDQEVRDDELFLDTNLSAGSTTFGYQQRYGEYKYHPDNVSGDFRDDLEHWHLGRIFTSTPTLNSDFIECDVDDRFLAVQDGSDYLYAQVYHNVKAIRPLPYFSDPRL